MLITVNGQPKVVAEHCTVLDLMRSLGVKPEITAVQHNEDIVDRKAVGNCVLMDGDSVELVRIVGGG